MKKFESFDASGGKISWIGPTFFFEADWMIYKKIYVNGFLFLISTILSGTISSRAGSIGIGFAISLFGNSMYDKYVQEEFRKTANIDEHY